MAHLNAVLHLDQQVKVALLPSLDMSTKLSSKGGGPRWTFPREGKGGSEEDRGTQ